LCICPTPKFLLVGKFSSCQKINFQKYKIWGLKILHFGEFKGKIEILSTHKNSSLSEMYSCLVDNCSLPIFLYAIFLTHDAADGAASLQQIRNKSKYRQVEVGPDSVRCYCRSSLRICRQRSVTCSAVVDGWRRMKTTEARRGNYRQRPTTSENHSLVTHSRNASE